MPSKNISIHQVVIPASNGMYIAGRVVHRINGRFATKQKVNRLLAAAVRRYQRNASAVV